LTGADLTVDDLTWGLFDWKSKRTTDLCNEVLEKVYTPSPKGKKRGNYQVLSLADRTEVEKYATQHSVNFL